MDIEGLIVKRLAKSEKIRVSDIVKETGFSRAYINRFFKKLRDEGKVVLMGKANRATYLPASKSALFKARKSILTANKVLSNKGLAEDAVLEDVKNKTGIYLDVSKNVARILDYGFTEMLNNAIEHSRSKKIAISFSRNANGATFVVRDWGVGIFKNIMRKMKLKNELEAIQDLTKGKQTTSPGEHTGEGIFFTSKVADMLVIHGSGKKLIFNNILDDVFIEDLKPITGTKVSFFINLKAARNLQKVFKEYSGETFEFSKTLASVKLYKLDTAYISRSQARRIISGLEKFKTVVLDFKGVDTVGQAFVDEVFRVWQDRHPQIKIQYANANQNIKFMIKRSL